MSNSMGLIMKDFNVRDDIDEQSYVVNSIKDFLSGLGGQWSWDDFTSRPLNNKTLNKIRISAISVDLPLSNDGRVILESLLDQAKRLTYVR